MTTYAEKIKWKYRFFEEDDAKTAEISSAKMNIQIVDALKDRSILEARSITLHKILSFILFLLKS